MTIDIFNINLEGLRISTSGRKGFLGKVIQTAVAKTLTTSG